MMENQYARKILPLMNGEWATIICHLLSNNNEEKFKKIAKVISACKKAGVKVCPEQNNMFRAFSLTPYEELKAVIIGQDPYPNSKKATGLAFAIPESEEMTPELDTIFQEVAMRGNDSIAYDITIGTRDEEKTLEHWAKQGVLLLNSALSVQEGHPGSHTKYWRYFIQGVIDSLPKDIIVCAWGKQAQSFEFNNLKVLKASHPVVHSYGKTGFLGCGHFNEINKYLINKNNEPIEWSLLPF